MSNYVRTSAIPWAESVCEVFEKQTGVKLLFTPPEPGDRKDTTDVRFHDLTWKFEELMRFSDEFIESGNENVAANILVRKWKRQNKSS